jgi:hypothetical protein
VQIEDGNRIHERRVRRLTDAWDGSILDSSIALLFTTLRSDLKTYFKTLRPDLTTYFPDKLLAIAQRAYSTTEELRGFPLCWYQSQNEAQNSCKLLTNSRPNPKSRRETHPKKKRNKTSK